MSENGPRLSELLTTAQLGLLTNIRARDELASARAAYEQSKSLKGLGGFLESARLLGEVKRAKDILDINETIAMRAYLPVFRAIVESLSDPALPRDAGLREARHGG